MYPDGFLLEQPRIGPMIQKFLTSSSRHTAILDLQVTLVRLCCAAIRLNRKIFICHFDRHVTVLFFLFLEGRIVLKGVFLLLQICAKT